LKARIFAVADAIDAITADRPYSKARHFEEVRTELLGGAGTHFDPQVVKAFCRISLEEWASLRDILVTGEGAAPAAGCRRAVGENHL
jgi:HD-GYP domain-containing protein (c-di-GMP phosphodiesterase class II)